MFQSPADIANRALQHCGLPRLDATLGFSEGTQRANETQFAYDKIKRAELRRNLWTFATRTVKLRPIDSNTMVLAPVLWESGVTYFKGSVVADAINFLWQSRIPNNAGNQPGAVPSAWEPYFGPLAIVAYDSTEAYDTGEIVYTTPGDGTYNVYLSLVSGNAVDPSLPNQWSATTTYFQNAVVQQFLAWASGTTYAQGQGALYTDGNVYVSLTNGNIGNAPPSSPTQWALMPTLILSSLPVPAIAGMTSSSPISSPIVEWSAMQTYSIGSFALFDGTSYLSLVNNNTGNLPSAGGGNWVAVTGGTLYMSLLDLNIGNSPASSPSAWTTSFTQGGGNQQWLQIGGAAAPSGVTLTQTDIVWPLQSTPSSLPGPNAFRLPAGYLRHAPSNPKAGIFSWLGAPGNPIMRDWAFTGSYIVSSDNVIHLRFVADVADVTQFDDMFCEAFAARLGMQVCKPLTQSTEKVQEIASEYKKWIGDAQAVNGIEIGATMPPLDDLIACRA